jgi:hypothetical protein
MCTLYAGVGEGNITVIRDKIVSTIAEVFEHHGSVSIDTPVFELGEFLAGNTERAASPLRPCRPKRRGPLFASLSIRSSNRPSSS